MCVWVLSICSADAAMSKRHDALTKARDLSKHVCPWRQLREKEAFVQSNSIKGTEI